MKKICKICKMEKPLCEFRRNGNSTGDGRDPRCLTCVSEYNRAFRDNIKKSKIRGET